jgi:hypothetical protein
MRCMHLVPLLSMSYWEVHAAVIDLTQFVLGGVFDLQGLCSRDSCVREAILRRIPLAFINDFGRTSAAERIADGHCDQGLATGTGTGTGAAVRCGVFQRPVRAGRRG